MRAGDFVGAKIYRKPAEDKRTKKDGTPRSPKKLGKIHFPVFTPGGTRVVGFMVRQSDIAGMIERPDRFVALDAIGVYEGAVAVDDVKGTYDAAPRYQPGRLHHLGWHGRAHGIGRRRGLLLGR